MGHSMVPTIFLGGTVPTQIMTINLVENQRKKESVDSELAHGRVNKFYWWVAIRSRAWGFVSLIV